MKLARLWIAAVMIMATLSATSATASRVREPEPPGGKDAVVVAVIDSGLVPYHWDFLASKMPQALNSNPSDDLPLATSPDQWLDGFPSPGSFEGYRPLDLKLEDKDETKPLAAALAEDLQPWEAIKPSTKKKVNYYWVPGTKVIGAVDFGGDRLRGSAGSHGLGTTSVSVGNIHGTCPECLLVFISLGGRAEGEAAIEWAMDQPWIDVITNSYGFSLAARDRIYSDSDVAAQRRASIRGQSIFFSAGNGQDGAFVIPNTTYFSSQEGPDWIITVGAVSPGDGNYYGPEPTTSTSQHASYSGHGKPADVASIGDAYPSAYTSDSISGTGASGFGGTSNATPTVAGIYARSLYLVRQALAGPSRIQKNNVIATGQAGCGKNRPGCEIGDGTLTADELRTRLLLGAQHTAAGMTAAGTGELPPLGEDEFMNEGHGSYLGREAGPENPSVWLQEVRSIVDTIFGDRRPLERPDGEEEWMIVDSFCRQHLWGSWKGGYYIEGETPLPGDDSNYPVRSQLEKVCPFLQAPP